MYNRVRPGTIPGTTNGKGETMSNQNVINEKGSITIKLLGSLISLTLFGSFVISLFF